MNFRPEASRNENPIIQILPRLRQQVSNLPTPEEQDSELRRILRETYHQSEKEIIRLLGTRKAEEPKPKEEEQKESMSATWRHIITRVRQEVAGLPAEDQDQAFEKIMRERYGFEFKNTATNEKVRRKIAYYIGGALAASTAALLAIGLRMAENDKVSTIAEDITDKKIPKKEIAYENEKRDTAVKINLPPPVEKEEETTLENPPEARPSEPTKIEPLFPKKIKNLETYEILPEEIKEIYDYFYEKDPTPGRGYQVLDKNTGKLYVFDGENNLVKSIEAGFGEDLGDQKNTSFSEGKGRMTTPAGAYVISTGALKEDQEYYGGDIFVLYGVSVLGNREFLGIHKTYMKELAKRTERLKKKEVKYRRFSNGCINISEGEFKQILRENFAGDFGELLFVLPDKEGKKKGSVFNIDGMIKEIAPVLIEMTEKYTLPMYTKAIDDITKDIRVLNQELIDGTHKGTREEHELTLQGYRDTRDELVKEQEKVIKRLERARELAK